MALAGEPALKGAMGLSHCRWRDEDDLNDGLFVVKVIQNIGKSGENLRVFVLKLAVVQ
jgi:hypothetical protein